MRLHLHLRKTSATPPDGCRFAAAAIAMLLILSIPLVLAIKGLMKTMRDQTDSFSY